MKSTSLMIFALLIPVYILAAEGYDDFFIQSPGVQFAGNKTSISHVPPAVFMAPENSGLQKSKGKAFFMSLIVPGLGERYAGRTARGNRFIATEILLWLGYAGFVTYRDWREEDYMGYAADYAHVDLQGKDKAFFINIGNYMSIDEYNAAKLRQRNLPKYYPDVEKYYWKWDNDARRAKFDQLRISSDLANNRSVFMLGAIFANHIISAIDAVVMVHKSNKQSASAWRWDVQFGDGVMEPAVQVGVRGEL
jgi:hypothetical protein